MNPVRRTFSVLRAVVRRLSGEDGYEAYLAHRRTAHADDAPPLSRAEWFRQETERRWNGGPRRCC